MKIEISEFMRFMIEFHQDKYPHQRFGQAFINVMTNDVVDSDVFYETDQKVCIKKIMKKYVELGD